MGGEEEEREVEEELERIPLEEGRSEYVPYILMRDKGINRDKAEGGHAVR